MKILRLLLNIACISVLAMTAVAQNKAAKAPDCRQEGGEVERKDDRFTGDATVTLKPQSIATDAPGQQLKLALSYKLKPEVRGREEALIPETIILTFTSTSPHRIYTGEFDVVFLIDGERVRRVPAAVHDNYDRLSTEKVLTQTVFTGMTTETLRRITRAKTVEMKLGETEVKLSPEVIAAMRSFAACALSGK